MAFHYRAIQGGRIVLVRALGSADPVDWDRLITSPHLPADGARPGLLVDLRPRAGLPTTATVYRAVDALSRAAPRLTAVALVAQAGAQFGCARMVDAITEMRALPARAFLEPRPAFDWLLAHAPPR